MIVLSLVGLVVSGLVVGALGRLTIPRPNPMSAGVTILVGIGGSLIGGLGGRPSSAAQAGSSSRSSAPRSSSGSCNAAGRRQRRSQPR